jgi:nucleoside-diphosphate-sugar epimerase
MTKIVSVSVLGCGWLGQPLAVKLVNSGYSVKGSSTDKLKLDELRKNHIEPFHVVLDPELRTGKTDFFHCNVCILNIPPARKFHSESYFMEQTEQVIKLLCETNNEPVKLLFVSSTSVYPGNMKVVKEDDAKEPDKASGKVLLKAEEYLHSLTCIDTTIVRFGGLVGYDRNPAKFLSGKKDLKNGNAPVNLIHRDDCTEIILRIIEQNKWGYTFNACMPGHPKRKDFYTMAAKKFNLSSPEFSADRNKNYKMVDSSYLIKELDYSFKYRHPFEII